MKIFASVALITVLIFTGMPKSHADDVDLFLAQIPPDALIVLDLSGTMNWVKDGTPMYINKSQTCNPLSPQPIAYFLTSGTVPFSHTDPCTITNLGAFPKYGDPSCSGTGGFFTTSTQANTWYGSWADCSRLGIAKRSIFDLLDDNDDNTINTQDETTLAIRLGYMRFYYCGIDDTGGDYSSGCNSLRREINEIGSNNYSQIWSSVNAESAGGYIPLASSLNEAKLYLDYHKNNDPGKVCRKKFAILVTDGADTLACYGTGSEGQTDQYRRRRESVAKAKALADAGYKVFVVGFGAGMSHHLKNTLNWMAYYGGTDNPLVANVGNTAQYSIPSIPSGSLYPSGITSCLNSYPSPLSPPYHTVTPDAVHYYATSNDPGELSLTGYAFLAENEAQLIQALKTIKSYIKESSPFAGSSSSFIGSAVPSVRFVDNDIVYVSSIEIPSLKGNLKAYQLNADGTLPIDATTKKITASPIWDAGAKLNQQSADTRKIYTYLGGTGKEEFKASNTNLTKEALGMPDDINRGKIIDHVRGIDAYDLNQNGNTTESRDWKLGDIFHSNAVIVGEPSRFFEDQGFSDTGGFYQTYKGQGRTKVVIVGANDGMLHAFNASTGDEAWGFIPNSLLTSLQSMVSTHTYYVDSSPKVADVWFYDNATDTGKTKTASQWKTVVICGLRKGGKTYFALNITSTLTPQYLWAFPKPLDSTTLAKVGQSWSEPVIGRVKMEDPNCDGTTCTKADPTKANYDPNHRHFLERWVAFIGGGFDNTNNIGKAFFVIDIKTGDIIKEFSGIVGMDYSFAASPTAVDTNSDGFIDKVYIGDLGGQMWVFDVSFNGTTKKSESQWTGQRLFAFLVSDTENYGKHRIYYPPAVAFDRNMTPWVYFGTGDREHPNDLTNPNERFYAVRDDELVSYPLNEDKLSDVTSNYTFIQDPAKKGWFIKLDSATSEKVLAKPVVFNRLVYFTTYAYTTGGNPCSVPGEAKLYIVEYLSGGGALNVDDLVDLQGSPSQQRSKTIGPGAPSAPVITVDLKGQASVTIGTTGDQVLSTPIFSPSKSKETLYWREVIP